MQSERCGPMLQVRLLAGHAALYAADDISDRAGKRSGACVQSCLTAAMQAFCVRA